MAIKVSLSQVVEALELASDEMSWFVHKQTGQVVMVSHEVMRLAEDDAEADLRDWQEEELRVTRDVLDSTDWLGLPSKFEVHEWEIMSRFAQSVAVAAQREEVLDAIHGSGAFRQFKSTIRRLRLEDAWFSFRDSAFEEMAKSWLEDHSFEIDDDFQRGGRPTRRSADGRGVDQG
jgi:hypothetical protein